MNTRQFLSPNLKFNNDLIYYLHFNELNNEKYKEDNYFIHLEDDIKENNINIDDTTSVILTPEPYIIESVLFKGIRNEEKLINYYKKIGFEFPPDEQIHMIGTIGNIINKNSNQSNNQCIIIYIFICKV